jgi:hypothetical protein
MAIEPDDEPNPYQSPLAPLAPPAPEDEPARLRKVLTRFQREIAELGFFWILSGIVAIAFGGTMLDVAEPGFSPLSGWLLILSAPLWFSFCVLSFLKHLWAVRTALAFTYAALLGSLCLAVVNPCLLGFMLVVLVTAVLQAHRVLRWAKELTKAGIPLTARPHDILDVG